MGEISTDRVVMEMGYSHEDFIRTLAIFLGNQPFSISGHHIMIPREDRQVEISLGQQGERRIGPTIRLPRTPVEIVFSGYAEEERKRFMDRFEMIFRRGGG